MIQRAKDLIKHPKKYDRVTSAGSASYILNIAFDKNTGEIVEGKSTVASSVLKPPSKYPRRTSTQDLFLPTQMTT